MKMSGLPSGFNINKYGINRRPALCSSHWGWGSVPSVCGPSWTVLLLHPWINYISAQKLCQTVGQNRCKTFLMTCDYFSFTITDWDRDWPVTGADLRHGWHHPWNHVLFGNLSSNEQAQCLFGCCNALCWAEIQSFYFEKLWTWVGRMCLLFNRPLK